MTDRSILSGRSMDEIASQAGDEWLHETKLVGDRMTAHERGARVPLLSRIVRDAPRCVRRFELPECAAL